MLPIIAMLVLAASSPAGTTTLPLHGPWPEPRPETTLDQSDEARQEKEVPKAKGRRADSENMDDETGTEPPLPIEMEDTGAYALCIAELKKTGAAFSEAKRIDDGEGCGIDRPIELRSLGGGIALEPAATLRCRTAVNLVRWTHEVVVPMLEKSRPEDTLASVDQASAYVCRNRNSSETGKITEHARGTAIDVAGFSFRSGQNFAISPREEDSTLNGAFQRAIASAACLYFSTVLDPGTDKAHETHLHLDTLRRKDGYRYCW